MSSHAVSDEPRIWFEDFAVGDVVVSPTRRLYESDVLAYVRFTNDVRPVLSTEGEPPTPLRVPDLLVFSLSICLLLHATTTYVPREFVAFYGFDTIDLLAPVFVGDCLSSRVEVVDVAHRGDDGIVSWKHEALTGPGICAVRSEHRILVRSAVTAAGMRGTRSNAARQ